MDYRVIVPGSNATQEAQAFRAMFPTDVRKYANKDSWHYLLASENSEPLAYCMFYIKSNVLIVAEIGVHPKHQRKGLGGKLVAYLEYHALQNKYQGIIMQQPLEYSNFLSDLGYTLQDGNAFKYWGNADAEN
jgi:GNAT superfamily N-acetyltransferase